MEQMLQEAREWLKQFDPSGASPDALQAAWFLRSITEEMDVDTLRLGTNDFLRNEGGFEADEICERILTEETDRIMTISTLNKSNYEVTFSGENGDSEQQFGSIMFRVEKGTNKREMVPLDFWHAISDGRLNEGAYDFLDDWGLLEVAEIIAQETAGYKFHRDCIIEGWEMTATFTHMDDRGWPNFKAGHLEYCVPYPSKLPIGVEELLKTTPSSLLNIYRLDEERQLSKYPVRGITLALKAEEPNTGG